MLYQTLEEALGNVAGRSFYGSCRVFGVGEDYSVEDCRTGVPEIVPWGYEGALTCLAFPTPSSTSLAPWNLPNTSPDRGISDRTCR